MKKNTLRFMANAGIAILQNDKKVLIDTLNKNKGSREPIFQVLSTKTYDALLNQQSPWDNISLNLITHYHYDHFCPEKNQKLALKNPNLITISNPQVLAMMPNLAKDSVCSLNPETNTKESISVKGIEISAYSFVHSGYDFFEVCNLAYIIDMGNRIVHTGDADLDEEVIDLLAQEAQGSVLIIPFPYFSLGSSYKIIRDKIKPKHLIVSHIPLKNKETELWLHSLNRSYDKHKDKAPFPISLAYEGAEIEISY